MTQRFLAPPGQSSGRGFLVLRHRDLPVDRWSGRRDSYRPAAASDDGDTPTFLSHPGTVGNITYSKTALWLRTLENHLGWETLREILSTFFQRYAFRHPTPDDFIAVANEVSGQDLSWYFEQVFHDSVGFDYAVDSAASVRVDPEGFVEGPEGLEYVKKEHSKDDDDDNGSLWRTEVVVRRLGSGRFPVEVLLVFKDGYEQREQWDGQSRWRRFTVERPARLTHAVVDPDGVLALDLHPNNNSRLRKAEDKTAARKWASFWMVWVQDLLATWTFFV
jgi:hypothetical protein